MKNTKAYLILVLLGTVTFSVGLWFYSMRETLGVFEISVAAAVGIIVLVSLVVGMNRMKDEKAGIPVEDELSKLIKQKAAAKAFELSFYVWSMIAVFTVDTGIRPEIPIGIGILATGLVFLILWAFYKRRGISDGNQD